LKHHDTKGRLIENTIHAIASEGLDKTTTKAIVRETDINEAYIYRHFSDKEELFARTFEKLDNELVEKAMENVDIMRLPNLDFELRCRAFFTVIWRFMLSNEERCTAYLRYYYSPYFKKYSLEAHTVRYTPFMKIFSEAFKDEANVWMILKHVLNVMLDFSVRVFEGSVPDNEDTCEHVFRLIYCSIKQYFK
jgi:AcrR family transcriptional regulator